MECGAGGLAASFHAAGNPVLEAGNPWLEVPEAEHNNILVTDFPLYAAMAHWLLEHVGPMPGV